MGGCKGRKEEDDVQIQPKGSWMVMWGDGMNVESTVKRREIGVKVSS